MRRILAVLASPVWSSWLPAMLRHSTYKVATVVARAPSDALSRAAEAADIAVFFSRHRSMRKDREIAASLPIPCVVQPDSLVRLGFDKRAMGRRALSVPGMLAIPEWTPEQAHNALRDGRVSAIVAKAPDATAGEDLRVYREPTALLGAAVRAHEAGYLLQPYLDGLEISVTLAWHAGRCRVYPPVSKGRTTLSGTHPTTRERRCPLDLPARLWEEVVAACIGYLYPFRPEGLVEVELLVTSEGVYLLDVNPRLAATLRLTAAVSNTNPVRDLLEAAAGVRPLDGVADAVRRGTEWPAPHLAEEVRVRLRELDGVWASTRVTVVGDDAQQLAERVRAARAVIEESE